MSKVNGRLAKLERELTPSGTPARAVARYIGAIVANVYQAAPLPADLQRLEAEARAELPALFDSLAMVYGDARP